MGVTFLDEDFVRGKRKASRVDVILFLILKKLTTPQIADVLAGIVGDLDRDPIGRYANEFDREDGTFDLLLLGKAGIGREGLVADHDR